MPSHSNRKKRTSRSAVLAKPSRRPAASHLLIIECEPEKLIRQQLDLGSKVEALFLPLFPNKKIVLVKASSIGELGRSLGETLQSHKRFRAILIVGHSNENGLQLTPSDFYQWKTIGAWLRPFEPEFLLLAACRAGRSTGTEHLFEQIPSLREIYASPVKFFSDQSHPFAGLLLALVKNRRVEDGWFRVLQVSGYALSDGLIYRWKRGEVLRGDQLTRLGWDFLGDIFDRRP